jgi:succinate dehydrogenase / fumarate reductase iron-sulfur subunit
MDLTLHVWRQKSRSATGQFIEYKATGITPEASFLEMLDIVNEELTSKGEDPIHFEHDCREGICGSCGMMINGVAHGPIGGTATCQLHMRKFKDGEEVWIEPWRARSFPVIKDLIVDRSPLDKIIQAGGFVSVNTGSAVEANTLPIPKQVQEMAMDAAACIQCGACVAQCPNGAANLFTAAKVSHLGLLPQGQPERYQRVASMVDVMESYFGSCTLFRECEAVCPKGISTSFIERMNKDYLASKFKAGKDVVAAK